MSIEYMPAAIQLIIIYLTMFILHWQPRSQANE